MANAVGMAAAEAHLSAVYGDSVFSNHTFVVCGDGCMMEGIASEAASLAGHLKLNKLIVIYDDNNISIDGKTDLAFSEDVAKRFESYGFTVFTVQDGDSDLNGIYEAIRKALNNSSTPSLIKLRTTIGKGATGAEGTAKVHGAPLGVDKVGALKSAFGFDPNAKFHVPDEVKEFYASVQSRNKEIFDNWKKAFDKFGKENPEKASELKRIQGKEMPQNFIDRLPKYSEASKRKEATRKDSEHVLNAIAPIMPELIGGSADLTESNLTKWRESVDFEPVSSGLGTYSGRYFRFGVREHAMFAMCNGMASYGCLVPFAATFLNFITYGWGAVRLSALSHFQVIYIMTHDSIGLGEDGPTHQPIETLALLRSLPNCLTFRPADGNEVSGAYKIALQHRNGPSVICLTRQKIANLQSSSLDQVQFGAYVAKQVDHPDVILIGTGSEVSLCIEAANESKHRVQVISMPCWQLFDQQSEEYKGRILGNVPVISVEAASTLGWEKYADVCIGLDTFGKSGPYEQVYKSLGLSAERIIAAIEKTIQHYKTNPVRSKKVLTI